MLKIVEWCVLQFWKREMQKKPHPHLKAITYYINSNAPKIFRMMPRCQYCDFNTNQEEPFQDCSNWQHLNIDHRLDNSIISILNFLILITILWLHNRMFSFLGNIEWNITEVFRGKGVCMMAATYCQTVQRW